MNSSDVIPRSFGDSSQDSQGKHNLADSFIHMLS